MALNGSNSGEYKLHVREVDGRVRFHITNPEDTEGFFVDLVPLNALKMGEYATQLAREIMDRMPKTEPHRRKRK